MLAVHLPMTGQRVTVHISGESTRKALVMFKQQTGYSIVFPSAMLNLRRRVSIHADQQPLDEVIGKFVGSDVCLDYTIEGQMIILQGIRYDHPHHEESLAATSSFTIEKSAADNLPSAPSQHLSEVVVIGYGTQKKSDLTGALSSVDMGLASRRVTTQPSQLLLGQAAGLNVVRRSGAPGSEAFVTIRGIGTINNSCAPIYVVDGVIAGTDISHISPADIEHIEVLKDASSTAIYGVQGSNGVILVTLRKGQAGRPHVSATTSVGVGQPSQHYRTLSADDYARALRTARSSDGSTMVMPVWDESYDGHRTTIDWQNVMFRPALLHHHHLSAEGGTEQFHGTTSLTYDNETGLVTNTDYERLVLRSHVSATVRRWLSFGGDAAFTHSVRNGVSANALNYATLTPTMDHTDPGGSLVHPQVVNPDGTYGTFYQSTGKTEVGSGIDNIYARKVEEEHVTASNNYNLRGEVVLTPLPGLEVKAIGSCNALQSDTHDVVAEAHRYNLVGGELLEQPLANQQTNSFFSLTKSNDYRSSFDAYATYALHHHHLSATAILGYSASSQHGSWNDAQAGGFLSPTIRDISMGSDYRLRAAAGAYNVTTRYQSAFARVISNYADRYYVTVSVRRDGSSHFPRRHRWGTFPSFAAAWRPTNEAFLSQVRWLDDFKLRVGWGRTGNAGNLGDQNVPHLSSDGIAYKFYTIDGSSQTGQPHTGLAQTCIVDEHLQWETNDQKNLGIDLRLLRGQLSLTAEYYHRTTTRLLVLQPLRPSLGNSELYTNNGTIVNHGFELTLQSRHTLGEVHLQSQLTLSTLRNRIRYLETEMFRNGTYNQGMHWQNSSICSSGYAIGSWYGYRTEGIFHTQAEVDAANAYAAAHGQRHYQPSAQPGDLRYADLNGDGTITESDRTIIGQGHPRLQGALTILCQWRGLDVSAMFHGEGRRSILSYAAMRLSLLTASDANVSNILCSAYRKAWSPSHPTADHPRLSITDPNWNMRVSNYWIRRGDYLKLDNLQIGYTLPQRVLRPVHLSRLRVYVDGSNLFTLSPYRHYGDPETTGDILFQGVDTGKYPLARTITIGLQLQM